MKSPIKTASLILLATSCLWIAGCANFQQTPNFSLYYKAITPLTKDPKPLPNQGVTGLIEPATLLPDGKVDPKRNILARNLQTQSHYTSLGEYDFTLGRLPTPQELANMTAKAGGDYYVHYYWPMGTATGTRMVMTGFTTPSLITTTSQGSAYGNYSGNYQNYYGGGGTIYGNANAYGYGSSQTTVGGSQSFQAVPFTYQVIANAVVVLATPQRQQQLIQDGVLSQATIDQYSLASRIKRGEAPAVIK